MKAKSLVSLVNLIVFLGVVVGCKGKAKEEYDFIAFKNPWHHQIFPTGTDYQIVGIGYDFGCDGTIDSVYVQATGEGLTNNTPGGRGFMDRWNTKYAQAEQKGRVKHVE